MIAKGTCSFTNKQLPKFMLFFAFFTFFVGPILAQGNLLIYPTRVVLDGKKKVEKVVLSNTGKDSATYNISFLEYKMNENGQLKVIEEQEEGLNFASPYVRVFPRVVTLGPGEGQTVKIQLNNTQNLPDGEFRSHLYFRAEKNNAPLGAAKKAKDSTISIKLEPIFGMSIACIVRKGTDETTVAISDLNYVKTKEKEDFLLFKLNRNGTMSSYGDFKINFTPINGKVIEVAQVKGVGVYTPGTFRNMKIKLNTPDHLNFKSGTFNVIFTQNESKKVLTEAEFKL